MNTTETKMICFSPTGTTQKILRSIISGINPAIRQEINLTKTDIRSEPVTINPHDLVIFGVPVYEEHIPPAIVPVINGLSGTSQNAVIVCVYGNVGYGLALQELSNSLTENNFNIIAGAAFIGEHSFSNPDFPIAANRPDEADLLVAHAFGKSIQELLANPSKIPVSFPGHLPFMSRILPEGSASHFAHSPFCHPDRCTLCGRCVRSCPMNAIDPISLRITESKCLRCFACVRNCPEEARNIKFKHGWLVKRVLLKATTSRKEPELFLPS